MHEDERNWLWVPIWGFLELFIITRFGLQIIDDLEVKFISQEMRYIYDNLTNATWSSKFFKINFWLQNKSIASKLL